MHVFIIAYNEQCEDLSAVVIESMLPTTIVLYQGHFSSPVLQPLYMYPTLSYKWAEFDISCAHRIVYYTRYHLQDRELYTASPAELCITHGVTCRIVYYTRHLLLIIQGITCLLYKASPAGLCIIYDITLRIVCYTRHHLLIIMQHAT